MNRNKFKTISKHGRLSRYKCTSEGLMHVAAWYHMDPGPKFTKFGEKCRLARPITLPNFVALRQKVCDISAVEKFCSAEK